MTTNALDAALAALREEMRLSEEHLTRLSEADGDLAERIAVAGETHAARLRVAEVERTLPGAAREHRAASFAEAVGSLFAGEEEPPSASGPEVPAADPSAEVDASLGSSSTGTPEPGADPLASLFS